MSSDINAEYKYTNIHNTSTTNKIVTSNSSINIVSKSNKMTEIMDLSNHKKE